MKLSKSLLGAILLGINLPATSCISEQELPKPESEQQSQNTNNETVPLSCPACGMG